jgi:hypothetical protein
MQVAMKKDHPLQSRITGGMVTISMNGTKLG